MSTSLLLLCCIVAVNAFQVLAAEVTFKGREYFSYNFKIRPAITTNKNVISLRFKTIHPSGLMLYSRGISDYFKLELLNGVLKYTLYLGGNEKAEIRAGNNLFNGQWHAVIIQRRGRMTTLKLDSQSPTTKILPGSLDRQYLKNHVFVGGMIDILRTNHGITSPNYRGCLVDLRFDDINLLDGARRAITNPQLSTSYNIYGNIPFKCQIQNYHPVTFTTPQSFAKVTLPKLPQDNGSFSLSFKFRTFYPHGLLLSRSAVNVKINIRLHDGALRYDVMVRNGSRYRIEIGGRLNDGEWHDVTARLSASKMSLSLDGYLTSRKHNMTSFVNKFLNQTWMKVFAGSRSKLFGFVGCMWNLKVDSHKIVLRLIGKKRFSHEVDVSKCSTIDQCSPNPCYNKGTCSQDWKDFFCDCSSTYFEGKTCQVPVLKPTCEDYRRLGLDKDAHCLLHTGTAKASGLFTALCNVTDSQRSYTIIEHGLLTGDMTKVQDGDLVGGQYYAHRINYHNLEKRQISALIQQSENCRQYIRFDCVSHAINSSNINSHVTWMSRDGHTKYNNWGVANVSIRCACSTTDQSQCVSPTNYCKCNQGSLWSSVEGHIDIKDQLPVIQLMFTKTTSYKESRFGIGPLECWGKSDKQDVQTNASVDIDLACYYVEPAAPPPTVTKVSSAAIVTVKPGRKGKERCFNQTFPSDSLGPIEWTNPPTIDFPATQENGHFNVQSQETNNHSGMNAPRIAVFAGAVFMWLFH